MADAPRLVPVQIPAGLADAFVFHARRTGNWTDFEEFVRETVRRRLASLDHQWDEYTRT